MSRRFRELTPGDLAKLPGLPSITFVLAKRGFTYTFSTRRRCTGIWRSMGPLAKSSSDSTRINQMDLLRVSAHSMKYSAAEKGDAWEPMIDEEWKPIAAKEIPILTEYIKMMIIQPTSLNQEFRAFSFR